MTVQPLSPRPSVHDPSQAEDFASLSTSRGARCAPVRAFQMRSQKRPALRCLFLMYPIDCLIPVAAEIPIPEMAQVETNNKNVIPTVSCCVFIITQVGGRWPGSGGAWVSKLGTTNEKIREGFYSKTIRKNLLIDGPHSHRPEDFLFPSGLPLQQQGPKGNHGGLQHPPPPLHIGGTAVAKVISGT